LGSKLKLALVGVGTWGKKLLAEYLSLSSRRNDFELSLVVDSDRNRLNLVGNEFDLSADKLTTDAKGVLKDETIQAVHIATPNASHFSQAMTAIEAHKHVLLEKPMALTMREAVKLARKSEEESIVLHVGHIFRFNNAIREARGLLKKGVVGKPLYYSLRWETLINPPLGRDIVFDLAPHPIDVLNYLSDEWPTRVLAVGRSYLRKSADKEEVAEAIAEFHDDVFAPITLSWLYSGPKRRLVSVVGDSGTIEIDALLQRIAVYQNEKSDVYPVEANNTIQSMIEHFVDCIVKGAPAENSALVGAMTIGVLSAMRESARTKRFVDVLGSGI
jgi:UDP-N-acetylglucosamine 3-dehydrogenase